MKKLILLLIITINLFLISGCSPEIGGEAWCKWMEERDKGDWSANEATDYAKHCLLK